MLCLCQRHRNTCLITLAGTCAVGLVHTSAAVAAVERAVKLVDGDGVLAVYVVISLNASKPGACMLQRMLLYTLKMQC